MDALIQRILEEFRTPFSDSVLVFSVILFIILLAPLLMSRLKIPGIIGLIISGILIGPHALNLIARTDAVDLFSTIGLLYIMFLAGLELDLGEFNKNRYKSLVFGILTFLLPIALGIPTCLYLLGYNIKTSLLTSSMFATHTLIAYPIVSRLGIAKTEVVAITVGGTILTDTAVLLILAAIAGAEDGGLNAALWTRLGISIAIFIVVVAFLIPRISAWFFKRLEDEKNAHFIFVLSVVFFCAFAAHLSGLEPIVGAFAAGLTLNRLIPHTSALMNRIEFVGNALFIPFFLISVGMLIDVTVLTKGAQAVLVAVTLTIVALAGKWGASYLTAKLFGYNAAQRSLIFGLSSAHAAATLAVILVGYKLGIIDDNILNGTIVLIMVTCLVASFVTEDAGKKVALLTDNETHEKDDLQAQRILVPIANPQTMERLINFAMNTIVAKSKAPIIALTVVEDDEQAQPRLLQAKGMLEKAMKMAAEVDQSIEITATIDQNIASGIKRVAKERFVSDIVMGWPGKDNLSDILFGRTFDSVVHQTSQLVFITRFTQPLSVNKRMLINCPALAEKEPGFKSWMQRIVKLCTGHNFSLVFFSTTETFEAAQAILNQTKANTFLTFFETNDLPVKKPWIRHAGENDIVVLVSARTSSISHMPWLETLPKKMVRSMPHHSLIFVYPESRPLDTFSSYTQIDHGGILETGWDILKGAKDILRKP